MPDEKRERVKEGYVPQRSPKKPDEEAGFVPPPPPVPPTPPKQPPEKPSSDKK